MNRPVIKKMYQTMLEALGPSHWWPGDTPFEIAIGAILTQNTNWKNVEKAINSLKTNDLLDAKRLYELPEDDLADLIRPAGYFRVKSKRIRNFLDFLKIEADYDIMALADHELDYLRPKILGVNGIGPETADCILLYSLGKSVFVVDTYTLRLSSRHGLIHEDADYHQLQELFMDNLVTDPALYNEYHALLVRVGKNWCKKSKPLCSECPLQPYLD